MPRTTILLHLSDVFRPSDGVFDIFCINRFDVRTPLTWRAFAIVALRNVVHFVARLLSRRRVSVHDLFATTRLE